jgi:hypothetical protein
MDIETARLAATVDLPTPPLPEATTIKKHLPLMIFQQNLAVELE